MPLFQVQDADGDMWVVAKDFCEAEKKWRKHVARENHMDVREVEDPRGIVFICHDSEFIK